MDGRPKRLKKFAFTSVCVYNRLLVDGALGFEVIEDRYVRLLYLEAPERRLLN